MEIEDERVGQGADLVEPVLSARLRRTETPRQDDAVEQWAIDGVEFTSGRLIAAVPDTDQQTRPGRVHRYVPLGHPSWPVCILPSLAGLFPIAVAGGGAGALYVVGP